MREPGAQVFEVGFTGTVMAFGLQHFLSDFRGRFLWHIRQIVTAVKLNRLVERGATEFLATRDVLVDCRTERDTKRLQRLH